MSRSLGLREDQRWSDELVTRIIGFLPVEPRRCIRKQARSHKKSGSMVGVGLPVKGPGLAN